jgi:ribonucleoside-diphosphate reductase alpha chain
MINLIEVDNKAKFKPEGLSETIFRERYAIDSEESWNGASKRLAYHVSQQENNRSYWSDKFYDQIVDNKFMPGGRIWYGAGRPRAQLLNCFVVPTSDSREGWGKTIHDVIVVSGMGGGVGINLSPIRPRGSTIHGTGGIATGSVSLMQMINAVGDVLVAGGGRRLALMLDLDFDHPDMPEFLDKKLDRGELNNANVSVILNRPTHEYIDAIKNGRSMPLMWGGEPQGEVNVQEIWEKLVTNAWKSGEPGILNGYLANQQNNIWFHKKLVSTNPCGEIWLEKYGCCDLGALVLPRFVNEFGQFDWEAFDDSIKVAVRFLDNVLSVNEYPLPEIRENCQDVRRIGLGIMGLHSLLIKLGYRYSSTQAKLFVNELMDFLKRSAYTASIELAQEKGQFPALDRESFINSGFAKDALPKYIKEGIINHGIRNCAILTIAPTGTTGMVSNVSTGIEPLFSAAYWRRFYRPTADGTRLLDKQLVVDPLWDELERQGRDVSVLEGAYDISPEDHFEMQKICQAHIDNATSKTINIPENYPVESLSDLWLEYLPYLKGTTLYRAGSRGEEPLEAIPLQEATRLMHAKAVHADASVTEQNSMDCVGDNCAVPTELKPHIEEMKVTQISFV